MTSCNRLCPTVEGSAPLITHRIAVEVCMARQRTFFHKCHRCIFRGKPANWEPEAPPVAMLNVHTAEEPAKQAVAKVKVKSPGATAAERPAAKKIASGGKAAAAHTQSVKTAANG